MPTTIFDIAKEAKVSIGAVSKALNDRKGVSEDLRSRIKGIATRLQYHPYLKAREVPAKAADQKQIACVFGATSWHLLDDVHMGMDEALMQSEFIDYRYMVQADDMFEESSKKLIFDKLLSDANVKGVLFGFLPLTDSDVARFKRVGIPVVQLSNLKNDGLTVSVDDFGAAYDATSRFIDFGHRVIGFILPNEYANQVWRDRLEGYKKALADHGIEYDSNWIGNESTFLPKEAGAVTHELLVNNPKMTAILYASDFQAMGGMKMIKEMHLSIPDAVAVMGFDNLKLCDLMDPPLASVRLPMMEIGKLGIELLLEAIQTNSAPSKTHVLKAEVVLRRSADASMPKVSWLGPAK